MSYIARELRAAIMYGSLPPGTQLGEAALAAQLNVSRGPLREAMQRLVQEGIVRSERNRGLFVVELDEDDRRDVYFARAAVERAAAQAFLAGNSDEALGRLEEALEEMASSAASADFAALTDSDLAFHETLVAQSGSQRLRRMYQTLLVEARMCMAELESTYPDAEEVVQEHRMIVEAVRSGDPERTEKAITEHLQDSMARHTKVESRHG